MANLKSQIKHLDSLSNDMDKFATKIVIDNKNLILNIVRKEQLGIGLNSDGNPLKHSKGNGFYKPITELFAKTNKPVLSKKAGSPYNFQWSGGTFKGMDLKTINNVSLQIFTKDRKNKLLTDTYGIIFDLTDAHNKEVNDKIITPKLYEYVFNNLFLPI